MINPEVILVNDQDEVIGFEDKHIAHQKGLKHRAISVLVFNTKGEWLLQKRATNKYHSGGLWTNTCCSHPYPAETTQISAERRLMEEMGMTTKLDYLFDFSYFVRLDNKLIENELDHVFIGKSDDTPNINIEEACDYQYITTQTLKNEIKDNPKKFTEWFKIIFEKVNTLNLQL